MGLLRLLQQLNDCHRQAASAKVAGADAVAGAEAHNVFSAIGPTKVVPLLQSPREEALRSL
jgi:hypothetical protein